MSGYDFIEFRKWFTEYDAKIWDDQIERDIEEGKLDKIANEAIAEFKLGNFKEL